MSMVQLTVIQCLLAFFVYTGMTMALPALILHPRVAHCRAVTRFFFYFSVGNFYLMNLVYVLQLLRISCWVTLVAGTVIPAVVAYIRIHRIPVRLRMQAYHEQMNRVLRGSFGVKNWLRRFLCRIRSATIHYAKLWIQTIRIHFADCLMIAVTVVVVLGFYGPDLLERFGYCASDISVHNYWINYLGKNEIFVAGVYPFGFHNIIYYLHTVFRMDTYVLLRVFWLVQVLWIHLVLMLFLKGVCKSRFLPYFGPIVYTIGAFSYASYSRYYASLPQEFGMLFILPAVYFAFEFFRIKKEELKGQREETVSTYYLMGFAMNFAMTFSVHFYGTIILGVFCLGIAAGYVWRFLQPKYFTKVVKTCFLALFIALLPMVIAYMTGTLLEGSLRWAMGVMAPEEEEEVPQITDREFTEEGIPIGAPIVEMADGTLAYMDVLDDGATIYYPIDDANLSEEDRETLLKEGYTGQVTFTGEEIIQEVEPHTPTMQERLQAIQRKLKKILRVLDDAVVLCLFAADSQVLRYFIYSAFWVTPVVSILLLLLRKPEEAFSLISTCVHVMLLIFMLGMPNLDLPSIMQQSRTCIYLNYSLPVLWVMAADRLLYLLLGIWRSAWTKRVMNGVSLAVLVGGCVLLVQKGLIKPETQMDSFQTNEAVTCLTNIIREEEDLSWTIVSAYDEMRMGEDHGYHHELITFLKDMEYTGGINMLTIPSKTVYFFIEKCPLNYSIVYEGSGQMISKEGAAQPLPSAGGFGVYMGENRWIVMSRFYEWAEAFRAMYPHEMSVYYENENFICYKLEQNEYHLFNMSIDYGYNMR